MGDTLLVLPKDSSNTPPSPMYLAFENVVVVVNFGTCSKCAVRPADSVLFTEAAIGSGNPYKASQRSSAFILLRGRVNFRNFRIFFRPYSANMRSSLNVPDLKYLKKGSDIVGGGPYSRWDLLSWAVARSASNASLKLF